LDISSDHGALSPTKPNLRLQATATASASAGWASGMGPPRLNRYLHLTRMHLSGILMHMRTTLNIDDSLLRDAAKLTGVKEKTSLVRLGLEALIAKESARRLANLGGTEKQLRDVRRRRFRRLA
jgi:Arc/MetJ family transcription regulator